jgi:hypothetical protein
MKTKTVTIYNWDGSKYDVEAPAQAKYIGILSNLGIIRFYRRKPALNGGYYAPSPYRIGQSIHGVCPEKNLPCHDGYGTGEMPDELLLKIEE